MRSPIAALRRRFARRRPSYTEVQYALLLSLFEWAPLGIVSFDEKGQIIYANRAFIELLGYSPSRLHTLTFSDVTHPDDAAASADVYDRLESGEIAKCDFDKRYVRSDHRVVWARVMASAVRDVDGRFLRTVSMVRDVTEQKRAEDALRISERRFEALVSSIDAIVWQCDAGTFGFEYVSPRARDLLGYPVEDWYKTPSAWVEHLHPDDRDEALSYCIEQTKAKRDHTFEYRMIAADGKIHWLRDVVTVVAEDGAAVKLRGVMVDVTAEREEALACKALAALVRSTDEAIIGVDADGHIESWNGGAERLYGYQWQEMLGRTIEVIIPRDRRAHAREVRARLKRGERIEGMEVPVVRKNGSLIEVSLSISPMFDATGKFVGEVSVAHDITERKRVDNEIRRLNSELEARVARRTAELAAANEELDAFNRSVSHDLRSPLRAAGFYADIVLRRHAGQLEPGGLELLKRARRAIGRMDMMIEELLRLSRTASEPLRVETIDVTALAEEIAAELRRLEPDRAVEVAISPGLSCRGDSALVKSALENLLGNAWKFTRAAPRPRIELGGEDRGDFVEFSVRDNGAGFDQSKARELFQPFYRLHDREEFEGTGLGLSIVKRAIERHGGKVSAEGEAGKGATFRFSLPSVKSGGRGGIRTPEGR